MPATFAVSILYAREDTINIIRSFTEGPRQGCELDYDCIAESVTVSQIMHAMRKKKLLNSGKKLVTLRSSLGSAYLSRKYAEADLVARRRPCTSAIVSNSRDRWTAHSRRAAAFPFMEEIVSSNGKRNAQPMVVKGASDNTQE